METVPPSLPQVVKREVLCVRCGYNLHTLAVDGACPECGLGVRTSLDVERGRAPVAAGARWLALGALLAVVLGGLEVLVSGYHDAIVLLVPNYIFSPWYTPLPPVSMLLSLGGVGAVGVVGWSGLGPPMLKWGRAHVPLYWICQGVCFLLGAVYEGFYFLMNLQHGRLGPSTLGLYRFSSMMLLVAMVVGFVLMVYAYLYMRGVAARPEFMRLRTLTLVLVGVFMVLRLASVGVYAYQTAMIMSTPMRAIPPLVTSLGQTIQYTRQALGLVEIAYWVFVLRLARSAMRAAPAIMG